MGLTSRLGVGGEYRRCGQPAGLVEDVDLELVGGIRGEVLQVDTV